MKRRSFIQKASAVTALSTGGLMTNILAQGQMQNPNNGSGPFHFQKSLERARQAPGMMMHFLATKEETNGAYALIEAKAVPGMEPPLHYHKYEDESFYMLDGEMIVTIGDKDYEVKAGDFIFLPRMIPHTQKILSKSIHVILSISPGGLEQYFWDFSAPAKDFEIPGFPKEPPSEEMMKTIMEMNKKYGIVNP